MSSMAAHQIKRSFFAIPTSGNTPSLPVSSSQQQQHQHQHQHTAEPNESAVGGLRRRLSSMSLKIQPSHQYSAYSAASFPRSKSLSSMGDYAGGSSYIRKWWEWGWAWILSRKPVFAMDLEMNEQETKILGSNDRGTWRQVFCKLRSEIRRLITSSDHVTLPQTYRFQDVHATTTSTTQPAAPTHSSSSSSS